MTSETRTVIDITDISGIEFECRHCGAKVLYPLAKHFDNLADECPNCLKRWFQVTENPNVQPAAKQIKNIIVGFRSLALSPMQTADHIPKFFNMGQKLPTLKAYP